MDTDLTGGVSVISDLTGWARRDLTGFVVVVVSDWTGLYRCMGVTSSGMM